MIILNGQKFASNDNEFTSSLFTEKTCNGFYKVNKSSITLQDIQRNKIGVINKYGVLCHARKLDTGKWWYSFCTIKLVGAWQSYMTEVNELKQALLDNKIQFVAS